MKKGFLLLAACCVGLSAAAQQAPTSSGGENVATRPSQLLPGGANDDKATNVTVGIKAGATLAHFHGDDVSSVGSAVQYPGSTTLGASIGDNSKSSYLAGGQGGVFVNIAFSKLISIQPELLYTQRGSRLVAGKSGPGYVSSSFNTRLHYFDIPLALRLNFGGVYLEGGPQVGLVMLARENFNGAAAGQEIHDVSFGDTSFKTGEFSYFGGLGYQSENGLGIGARYNRGNTNVVRNTSLTTGAAIPLTDAKSAWFQLFLSYSFK